MVKRFIAYSPGSQQPDTVRQFRELQDVVRDIDETKADWASYGILYGDADSGTIGTGYTKLTNYESGGARGIVTVDQAAGEITLLEPAVARVTLWVMCQQGSNVQNEQLQLYLNGIGQSRRPAALFDIATNKTNVRYLAASYVRPLIAARYWLELRGTADLGDFGTVLTSFELEAQPL